MNYEQRSLLLRARFKALGGTLPPRSIDHRKPEPARKPYARPSAFSFGPLEYFEPSVWLTKTPKREEKTLGQSNLKKVSALTKISEQLPIKLKRLIIHVKSP